MPREIGPEAVSASGASGDIESVGRMGGIDQHRIVTAAKNDGSNLRKLPMGEVTGAKEWSSKMNSEFILRRYLRRLRLFFALDA